MTHSSAGLQHVIQGLSSFWAERGCALLPPCTLEIPAALLHPKTFFRLLDPQPWRGVVAQPVSRPVDGRRGRHPFRTSLHLQLQVALQQPEPVSVRDEVVESLRTLGLDPARHHLRFDSWRWHLDAVGGHGLGWRMTLDGVGIGRITFLDRLADRELPGDRVDVTYGAEHLAMVLGGADSVYRLAWQSEDKETKDAVLRYDHLRRTDEEEQSRYVEEVANVGHLRQVLDGLEREARRCLDAGLVRPSYERAIECLAVLDVLDVRRDLTDRERDEWTAAVRSVVAGAAELHLARTLSVTEKAEKAKKVEKVEKAEEEPVEEPDDTSTDPSDEIDETDETDEAKTPDKPAAKKPAPKKPAPKTRRKPPKKKSKKPTQKAPTKAAKKSAKKSAEKAAEKTEPEDADG